MTQDSKHQSAENGQNEMWLTILVRYIWRQRDIRMSLLIVCLLLAWDVAITGSYLMSLLFCPIWFLVSLLKNAIQRPGWRLAFVRIAIPALTLWLVMANNAVQLGVAEANAPRIITACEKFYAINGRFPKTLDKLLPNYISSIPRAKYCLGYGNFAYWNLDDHPMLVWCVVPPFGRRIYDFKRRQWSYLD